MQAAMNLKNIQEFEALRSLCSRAKKLRENTMKCFRIMGEAESNGYSEAYERANYLLQDYYEEIGKNYVQIINGRLAIGIKDTVNSYELEDLINKKIKENQVEYLQWILNRAVDEIGYLHTQWKSKKGNWADYIVAMVKFSKKINTTFVKPIKKPFGLIVKTSAGFKVKINENNGNIAVALLK